MMEVSFPSSDDTFQLYGDLTLPSAPSTSANGDDEATTGTLLPAIVIVAGSGPIDRNGNAPSMRMKLNTSNRFAEHMSSRSSDRPIAVLSYDKRGVGKSKRSGDKNLYYRAGMMDFVKDAVEAVRYLSAHPRIDRKKIVLLGHSEGAIILPLICREVDKNNLDLIFGCIFYSGFGENVEDAMTLQRKTIVEEVQQKEGVTGWLLRRFISKDKLEKQYNDLMIKVNAEDNPDFVSTHCGLVKQPAKWFREHVAYDASGALVEHISCHCLAVTGCNDVQVTDEFCKPEIAAAMVPNAASVEAHRPANLTHVLRSMDGPSKLLDAKKDYVRMGKMMLGAELLSITDIWCDRILFSS
mmetsp:Transcript_1797/g.4245  ORF Transcript_1797/g.4245 Transcript_1797/m.4245 type:complete len:353 (-) Transcript_1797:150-1208(-)